MVDEDKSFSLRVESTSKFCPTGQIIGKKNLDDGKIPVLSCVWGDDFIARARRTIASGARCS